MKQWYCFTEEIKEYRESESEPLLCNRGASHEDIIREHW